MIEFAILTLCSALGLSALVVACAFAYKIVRFTKETSSIEQRARGKQHGHHEHDLEKRLAEFQNEHFGVRFNPQHLQRGAVRRRVNTTTKERPDGT